MVKSKKLPTLEEVKELVRANIIDLDASRRGGVMKVNVEAFFETDEEPTIGAYQNYLGGGMLGAVQFGSNFAPSEEQAELFQLFREATKQIFFAITNEEASDWDEWSEQTYEQNQRMAKSGY